MGKVTSHINSSEMLSSMDLINQSRGVNADIASLSSQMEDKASQKDNVTQRNFDANLDSNFATSSDYLTNGYSNLISTAIVNYSPLYLTDKKYQLKTPITLTNKPSFRDIVGVSSKLVNGSGYTPIGGSILVPDNGVTALSVTNMNGMKISKVRFSNENYTDATTKIVDLDQFYTSAFEDCEFRGTMEFTETDSAKFFNCRFYGGSVAGSTVTIGKGCRSIYFIGCNFEDSSHPTIPFNIVIDCADDVSSGSVNGGSNIHFIGCQFENVVITYKNCTDSSITSSKTYKTKILLERSTSNIKIDGATQTGSTIGNFGFNNNVNAKCWNAIGTGIEMRGFKPTISYNADNTVTMTNDLLISQCFAVNTSITSGTLSYKDGVTSIKTSESFNLKKASPYTSGNEIPFTDFQVLTGTAIKVSSGVSDPMYIRTAPLKNLIGSTMLTGWSATWNPVDQGGSCSVTSGSTLGLTIVRTTSGSWGVTKTFTFNPSKQYMLLMRYSTTGSKANFQGGNMLRTQDVSYQYQLPNGDYLAQSFVSGTYETIIYIGGFTSNTNDVITVQWAALVEVA